jgi:hypothetical protein
MHEGERDLRQQAEDQHGRPFHIVGTVGGERETVGARVAHFERGAQQRAVHRLAGFDGDLRIAQFMQQCRERGVRFR